MEKEVLKFAKEKLKADYIEYLGEWNNYKVYDPMYNKQCDVGLPYAILVKDNKIRICSDNEVWDIFHYFVKDDEKE